MSVFIFHQCNSAYSAEHHGGVADYDKPLKSLLTPEETTTIKFLEQEDNNVQDRICIISTDILNVSCIGGDISR